MLNVMTSAASGRVVLVQGPQEFFAERAIAAVTGRWRADGLEVRHLSAAGEGLPAELMSAAAPDLFGSSPGVVLRDAELLSAEVVPMVVRAIEEEPGTPWVIHHGGGRGSTKVVQTLRKVADDTVAAEPIKGKAVADFVQKEFRTHHKTADHETIALLIEAIGADPRGLASAIAQLASDIEGTHIGREQAALYYSGHVEVKGYEIADAVARRDTTAALEGLRFALREGGTSAGLMTATALTTTLHRMAVAKAAPGGSAGTAEVAAALKIPDWMARTAVTNARRWTQDGIADAIAELAELTVQLKGGYQLTGALSEEQKGYELERAVIRMTHTAETE
jgi:DNA polymerase III subunit delta